MNDSVASTQQEKITVSSFLRGLLSGLKNVFSVSTFFVAFKYIAFVGFTGISAILSVNMFNRLSTQPLEQFALVSVAITLEFFKIFSIVRGNTLWRLKLRSQAVRAYSMYAILALIAVMASYGFTLTVINRNIQVSNSSAITLQIENSKSTQRGYEASIKSIDANILANQTRLTALPPEFISAAQTLNNTLSKLQSTEADLQAKLSTERANQVTLEAQAIETTKSATTSASMFKLMANGFKWLLPTLDENTLMLFLLLVISIVIELGIISTSPAIPIDQKHLKHFLDEMSAHKAVELLDEVAGRKKREVPRRQTFAGRVAQWWMNTKKDVNDVTHPTAPPVKVEMISAPRQPRLMPTESTSIGSVPVRRQPEHIEPSEPWPRPEAKALEVKKPEIVEQSPVIVPEEIEPPKEAAIPASTFPTRPPQSNGDLSIPAGYTAPIPVRPSPPVSPRGPEATEGPHEEPNQSPVAPQLVGEARIYRFGKTTEAVKDMFVTFVQKLFNNEGDPEAPLRNLELAATESGVPVALAKTFEKRLQEIKGSRGVTLIEKRDDEKLYPNYPEGYIIAYATAEPAQRTK